MYIFSLSLSGALTSLPPHHCVSRKKYDFRSNQVPFESIFRACEECFSNEFFLLNLRILICTAYERNKNLYAHVRSDNLAIGTTAIESDDNNNLNNDDKKVMREKRQSYLLFKHYSLQGLSFHVIFSFFR